MDGLEAREVAYFVAVAEELNFSRAANRLGIAQPPLSRAVKQLERRLGVVLLERTSRRVTLTAAGQVLLNEGRRALDALAAAARRAQRAGQQDPRLVLVTKAVGDGGMLPEILAAYESEPDAIKVDVLFCGFGEQTVLLRSGVADVGLLHGRPDLTGLDFEDLLVEHQIAVLPARHRLAGRAAVTLADLDGEAMPRFAGMRHDGTEGPEVHDAGQLMQLIAMGRTTAILPESARGYLAGDLVCVPVLDAPPSTMMIAWPEQSRSPALATFVRAATDVAARRRVRCGPDSGYDGNQLRDS
ncbi:LysR family transcriptional regulator [Microtetraspora sp. NBRC 16547]|uniref:LysR family transcriptional regulator n=1 Tax=Microtetraspora sp. NBRC 16547 TaxID=3030993 RepID=UPI00255665EB|nr:LysR family transcriptional regulator [Microtetraspora sp. NBRC 16547]